MGKLDAEIYIHSRTEMVLILTVWREVVDVEVVEEVVWAEEHEVVYPTEREAEGEAAWGEVGELYTFI